jgi:hypothetical protein
MWWPGTELNRRRQPFQGCALPPELPGHVSKPADCGTFRLTLIVAGFAKEPNASLPEACRTPSIITTAQISLNVQRAFLRFFAVRNTSAANFGYLTNGHQADGHQAIWVRIREKSLPSLLSRETLHELNQTAQGYAGRAFRDPRLLIIHPRGAGYVEVDPRRVFGKFFQEHRCCNRAAPASA